MIFSSYYSVTESKHWWLRLSPTSLQSCQCFDRGQNAWMLFVDVPTESDIIALASARDDLSVSIYLPTTPLSQEAASDSVQLKNLSKESLRKLAEAGADKSRMAALLEHFDALIEDPEFWRFRANSLVVLATPDNVQTFVLQMRYRRLP